MINYGYNYKEVSKTKRFRLRSTHLALDFIEY
jgi:hypothetical protein